MITNTTKKQEIKPQIVNIISQMNRQGVTIGQIYRFLQRQGYEEPEIMEYIKLL